jgi:hypothetical protein
VFSLGHLDDNSFTNYSSVLRVKEQNASIKTRLTAGSIEIVVSLSELKKISFVREFLRQSSHIQATGPSW